MNYELAKQLKDAGFQWQFGFHCIRNDDEHGFCTGNKPDCNVRAMSTPTLEELIEACGHVDLQVRRNKSHAAQIGKKPMTVIHGEGSTPTEAVAKLWLALQAK